MSYSGTVPREPQLVTTIISESLTSFNFARVRQIFFRSRAASGLAIADTGLFVTPSPKAFQDL